MQLGKTPGTSHGIRRRRRANHQARRRQNAVTMPLLNRLVDRRVEAKIIGANNEAFHETIFRLKRALAAVTPLLPK